MYSDLLRVSLPFPVHGPSHYFAVEALDNTSLTFDPPLVGYACEITYSFTSPKNISQG